ncbi:MAG: ECF transporter S component [Ruminococcaceae bacterium]|nr:ECF transporter S component [Oscillospiraceae bacterium]
MKNTATRTIIYSGFFTALGVLFPMIFHTFGALSGQTFLPMHIPVLIAGLLISPYCGLVTGILSPFLSCLITQMPTMIKMPFMCIELAVYGLSAGLFMRLYSKKIKNKTLSIYTALVTSQILGRLANLLCTYIAVNLLGVTAKGVSVKLALMSIPAGFVGILIQWIVIPPIVRILSKLKK